MNVISNANLVAFNQINVTSVLILKENFLNLVSNLIPVANMLISNPPDTSIPSTKTKVKK